MLHRGDRRTLTTKQVRETEAEAVAFVVCQSGRASERNFVPRLCCVRIYVVPAPEGRIVTGIRPPEHNITKAAALPWLIGRRRGF